MLSLMDHYSGGWNVLIIAAFELACIGWVYGKLSIRFVQSLMSRAELCITHKSLLDLL